MATRSGSGSGSGSSNSKKGGKIFSKRQSQQLQQQQLTHKRKALPVTDGLQSPQTETQYNWHFRTFIKYLEQKYDRIIVDDMLLDWDPKEIENLTIEYLKYMNKERHLKHSTINAAMAAIFHFCKVNDIWSINKERVAMFVPPDEDHKTDRAYTRKEIEKLLKESDKRYRVIFLLMANGLRIGALPDLELRDLIARPLPMKETKANAKEKEPQKVYQIWVYHRSKKGEYYTFVTPECTEAIDDYLKFRGEQGEKDVTVHDNNASPLIRDQFSLGDRRQAANPRKIVQGTLEKTIERTIKRAGLDTTGKVMMTHGFRKFAITQMIKAKVWHENRESLVGHKTSRGLDTSYGKLEPDERLEEWCKAINNLTIDPVYHLRGEVEIARGETAQKIAQQELEMDSLKAKLEIIIYCFGAFWSYKCVILTLL